MVLGENIGTTITANMAALVANNNAKRAARFHFLFNVVGVIWMLFIFNWVIQFLEKVPLEKTETIELVNISVPDALQSSQPFDADRQRFLADSVKTHGLNRASILVMPDQLNPDQYVLRTGYNYLLAAQQAGLTTSPVTVDSPNDRLPLFHTFFNVVNVLLLVWFLPFFERLVYRIVPSSSEDEEETSLRYIVAGIMETPELSIEEARKETAQMGKLTQKMMSNVILLYFGKPRDKQKLIEKIRRREEITDQMELEIANFLSAVSEKDISSSGSQRIQSLLAIINELERVGDIFCRLALSEPKLREDQITIPEEVKIPIQRLFDRVLTRIKQMAHDLEQDFSKVDLPEAELAEQEIDTARDQLNLQIFRSLEMGKITALQSIAFLNLIASVERVGDLILNVNRYMAGHK
jgi:phosphate:Na+ symporter